MSSYSMHGNGMFGGSNNFLSLLGGIGDDWSYGMNQGMNMGLQMLNYNNAVNLSPSAMRAKISKNIAEQGYNEGSHYIDYMMNQPLSYLAGGGDPTHQDSPYQGMMGRNWLGNVLGTPNTNWQANQATQRQPTNASGTQNYTVSPTGGLTFVPVQSQQGAIDPNQTMHAVSANQGKGWG